MRLWPVVALVVLGCGQGKRDVVVAKAEIGGVPLVMRRYEVRFKRPCREEGLNLYKCLLVKTEKSGCIYLDIGGPLPAHAGDNPCAPGRPGRRLLIGSPVDVDFEVDPAGERIAWRDSNTWHVGYLVERQLLVPTAPYYAPNPSIPKSTSAIDWRAIKSLEDAAPQLYFESPAELQPILLERMRGNGGDRPVSTLLSSRPELAGSPAWEAAYQTLDEAHRKVVIDAMTNAVLVDGVDDPITWFDAHPEVIPKDFEARLRKRALDSSEGSGVDVPQRWLLRAYQHHDPAAAQVACQMLEQRELWNKWGQGGENGSEPDNMPYAVIAATHSKCPAVAHALDGDPCSPELRCGHGWAPGEEPENKPATRVDTGDPWDLCDAEDLEQLKKALLTEDGHGDYGDFDAAAKMNALLAQGPLPKDFQVRAARRDYRQQLARTDAGEYGDGTPCDGEQRRLSDFFCAVRLEQTHLYLDGCHVEIDDEKKVVRLWEFDQQDGGR